MSFKHAGQLDIYEHLLFELRMRLSGLFASGGRAVDRERVPRRMALQASCDSGAVGGSVWCVGDF